MAVFIQGPPPKGNYTMVTNDLARDPSLSLQAKGLYLYLRSHRDGWSMSAERVAESVGVTRKTLTKYVGELEKAGYLEKMQTFVANGDFGPMIYMIYGEPEAGKEDGEERFPSVSRTAHFAPGADYAGRESTPHKKTNSYKKTKEEEKTKDITPYRPPEGDSLPREATKTRNRYPDEFEQWWRTYPRRKNASKKAAHTQWAKAVKLIDHQRLLDLTATYARNPGVSDERYIPHPQKWLKDQRWESIDETNNYVEAERVADGTRPEDWLAGYMPAPANEIEAEVIPWQIEA